MAERISAEYETFLSLNGNKLVVHSKKVWWSGDRTEPRGYWLKTNIYTDSKGERTKGFEEQREITKEPVKYAEIKHGQMVILARKCAKRGCSLEELSLAVKEIFNPKYN